MPEHGRLEASVLPAVGPCAVPACPVCALAGGRPRATTVAEWLAERLLPVLVRARERRRDRLADLRPGSPAVTPRPWPYSAWWDESLG
ncbi:hypothetical protein ACUN7V_12390 [Quadrisphaera oryzae]|uniref:hypothetical protein n=1 Tax=Quadrisphaera TaxID=317661 RepID=UPI0016486499|nr:hypothetical protein [Quadrisphaera sp. RL12-1S]MBC3762005.1 hypothetical protein [Quadrisphaera sp. RL12-1S]